MSTDLIGPFSFSELLHDEQGQARSMIAARRVYGGNPDAKFMIRGRRVLWADVIDEATPEAAKPEN